MTKTTKTMPKTNDCKKRLTKAVKDMFASVDQQPSFKLWQLIIDSMEAFIRTEIERAEERGRRAAGGCEYCRGCDRCE